MPESGQHQVILVGPMGSGKTTLGRRVAKQLGLRFVDCDEELEKQTGAEVSLIFDIEGEHGFRERETRMLKQLLQQDRVLIATGGGVVTVAANRQLLKGTGTVVWLRTSVAQQLRRLSQDRKRPLLQTEDRRGRLESMAATRDPLYAEVADMEFRAGRRSLAQGAQALAEALENRMKAGSHE